MPSTSATASSTGGCATIRACASLERQNARSLTRAEIPEPVELVVADVSFISLRLVLPAALAPGDGRMPGWSR